MHARRRSCDWAVPLLLGRELPRARHQPDSGGVNRYDAKVLSTFLMDKVRAVKTATDRAAAAIEAAEIMFANEMGATLDLCPAAKVALISQIAAEIQAAVAEERDKLIPTANKRSG